MSWFTSTETYSREIWSEAPPDEEKATPGRGEKAEVTMRRLNAGDRAAIQDTLRMSIGEDVDASMALGTMRMLSVQRALVDWTLPGPKPSQESISQLSPIVFEQIYGAVDLGEESPTSEQPPGAVSENEKKPKKLVPAS